MSVQDLDMWSFLAGLGLFLYGMFILEESLKILASRSFKKFLRNQTQNRFKAIFSGAFSTAILQSSSVVMLMVLALVGAGVIKLSHALGVILGSNLGTTFTGWVVASIGFKVQIEEFALVIIAIGAFLSVFFSKPIKLAYIGRLILGFGFLFYGLINMKLSVAQFAQHFDITQFSHVGPFLFLVIGFIFTAIIQSSSATMVIALTALNSNLIALHSAAALVIGADLGTTITAILGSLKGSSSKKRVALAHFLFNLVTDLLAFAALPLLLYLITQYFKIADPLYILVMFHSLFNFVGILLFLPFLGHFSDFLNRQFKGEKSSLEEKLNLELIKVPTAAIEALNQEVKVLLFHVIQFNQQVFRLKKRRQKGIELLMPLFDSFDYSKSYNEIKSNEGEIVGFTFKLEVETLSITESQQINSLLTVIRYAVQSAKSAKDVILDIEDFSSSANNTVHSQYRKLKENQGDFYNSVDEILRLESQSLILERLLELLDNNKKAYKKKIGGLYKDVSQLKEKTLSTMLNVNREIYMSNKSLILALKDFLLDEKKSDEIEKLS